MFISYRGKTPDVHPTAFVADGAKIIGDVTVGERSTVWFNTVLRGDIAPIRIGRETSIQDCSVGHVDEGQPLIVGDRVTVGHGAIIHGCTIGDDALIGMGAVVLSGAKVGEGALVAAGAVVRENAVIPPRTLVAGVPAKPIRELTEEECAGMAKNAQNYVLRGKEYRGEVQ
jgi:carbonic anhydrase/acetyltransferase-like protein (isoleucine patch superfamily)